MGIQIGPGVSDFFRHTGDHFLPGEAGVHGHQQHAVNVVKHIVQHLDRGGGIQGQHGPAAQVPDHGQGPLDVWGAFPVDADEFAFPDAEPGQFVVRPVDHQMQVQRNGGVAAEIFAEIRAQGEIGHEFAVHNVHMEIFDALGLEAAEGIGHFRKVHAHHGWGKLTGFHRFHLPEMFFAYVITFARRGRQGGGADWKSN